MKKSMKQLVLWIASLSLLIAAGVVSRKESELLSGVSGFFVDFFLMYCAVIVVAQGFALREELSSRQVKKTVENQARQATIEESELDLETTLS